MRASIACTHCRRSKVKCVNNGIDTTCHACQNSKRGCTYNSAGTHSTATVGVDGNCSDTEKRPKRKRAHSRSSSREATNQRYGSALESAVLTRIVWLELYEIWKLHYSIDLPFLHPVSFVAPLHPPASASDIGKDDTPPEVRPAGCDGLLLAFLALTARYHQGLVEHHSSASKQQKVSEWIFASEYYAKAARSVLEKDYYNNALGDLDQIQGTLMLGLHEWGMCNGKKAWMHIGSATRAALAMGLHYQIDNDSRSSWTAVDELSGQCILQEARRRTLWSCFIMDRYVSSGKYRPQMLHVSDITVQLPASDEAYIRGITVMTPLLDENEARFLRRMEALHKQFGCAIRTEAGFDEGVVSRYTRMVELYGLVVKYSVAGGRRAEIHPPWDVRSEWHKLTQMCNQYKASLPQEYVRNARNTQVLLSQSKAAGYVLMHCLYLLCQIMLHREYVPFIPLRCDQPVGPLDEPTFPLDRFTPPPGFWHDSAAQCMQAARDITDMLETCHRWGVMTQTPVVGFCLYIASFTGIWCNAFPWMDPAGSMCKSETSSNSKGLEATKKATAILQQMRSRLRLAEGWCQLIDCMRDYFDHIKIDFSKSVEEQKKKCDHATMQMRTLSLRDGGDGGALDEWTEVEHVFEFGHIQDQDLDSMATSVETLDKVRRRSRRSNDASDRLSEQSMSGSPDQAATSTHLSDSVSPKRRKGDEPSDAKRTAPIYTFKTPLLPVENVPDLISASPTVYTPEISSTQPSPSHIYMPSTYNMWHSLQGSGMSTPASYHRLEPSLQASGHYTANIGEPVQFPLMGLNNNQMHWPLPTDMNLSMYNADAQRSFEGEPLHGHVEGGFVVRTGLENDGPWTSMTYDQQYR